MQGGSSFFYDIGSDLSSLRRKSELKAAVAKQIDNPGDSLTQMDNLFQRAFQERHGAEATGQIESFRDIKAYFFRHKRPKPGPDCNSLL